MRFIGILLLVAANGYALWTLDTIVFMDLFTIEGPSDFFKYGVVGLIFSIVNAIIRPVVTLLSIPIKFLTLGLFSFVVNAGLFWLVNVMVNFLAISGVVMNVDGWIPLLVGGVIMGVVNSVLHWFV